MDAPELVSGLIIQNANAHRTGFGPQWRGTLAFWSQPNPENEAAATAHLTFDGVRDQYVAGWGRHDAFFDLAETLSWMQGLPRMEAHVFDA